MTKQDFVKKLYPYAKKTQDETGMSAIAILAQAAQESAWGSVAPGNMYFGVKDSDGINGNEQLLTTTEYSRRADLKFPEVISVTPVLIKGSKLFKYRIKDYFRKYDTPTECFTDHANFLLKNKRYANAIVVRSDPFRFIDAIAAAGYATDPNYGASLKSIARSIQSLIK